MRDGLAKLYALQEVDSALIATQGHLDRLDRAALEQEAMQTAQAAHDAAVAQLHQYRADLRATELEAASVQAKKKSNEDKLYGGRVSAYKEMEAMTEEIQSLDRQRARLEDRVLELWDLVSEAEKAEATTSVARGEAEAAYAAKRATFSEAEAKLHRRMRQLLVLRAQRLAPVPPDLVKRYDAIRTQRRGVGIARLDGNDCGACHMAVAAYTLRELREQDGLCYCEGCGRILCEIAPAAS